MENAATTVNVTIEPCKSSQGLSGEELGRRWFADYSSNSRMSKDMSTKVTII
jgi:hypothetical protein